MRLNSDVSAGHRCRFAANEPRPRPEVLTWLERTSTLTTFLSAMSLHEIRFGIELLDVSPKRTRLEGRFSDDLMSGFTGRILPIDAAVANECGRLVARCRGRRHTPSLEDAMIAATARVHGLAVATMNREHFKLLEVELARFEP